MEKKHPSLVRVRAKIEALVRIKAKKSKTPFS